MDDLLRWKSARKVISNMHIKIIKMCISSVNVVISFLYTRVFCNHNVERVGHAGVRIIDLAAGDVKSAWAA